MAIRDVVTGGFGNGTFSGTIALVVTRGYSIGAAITAPVIVLENDVFVVQTRTGDVMVVQTKTGDVSMVQIHGEDGHLQ